MEDQHRALIAITGANGTIGYACVVYALQAGFRVRCVVRREAAVAAIQSRPSVQEYRDRIEYALVPENTTPGAYDQAVAGVQYVVHVAGAWPMPHLHPDHDIYYPFLNSTAEIVSAARKSGTVKRIVFTQAGAGLVNSEEGDTLGTRMDRLLDENTPVDKASQAFQPPLKSAHNAYCAAKAQCMTYLDQLRLDKTLPFSIAQIIPGTVIGPSEFATTSAEALARLDRQTKALLFNDARPRYAFGFVHVHDCARVHIEALDEGKVKKEQLPPWYIAAATVEQGQTGQQLWHEAAEMIERKFRAQVDTRVFEVGRAKVPTNMPFRVNSRRTERMLLDGEKMRGLQESVQEVAEWYLLLKDREA